MTTVYEKAHRWMVGTYHRACSLNTKEAWAHYERARLKWVVLMETAPQHVRLCYLS